MGIKGLKSTIKKYAPESFTHMTFDTLRGKTVCIDSSIMLYKFRYTFNTENFHILGFLNKIIELKEYDINMIFVFDGKPPEAKRKTITKRKEKTKKIKEELKELKEELKELNQPTEHDKDAFLNSDSDDDNFKKVNNRIKILERNVKTVKPIHSLQVIELLKSIGIPFFVSETEAEKACAYLQKNGYCDYILTEDTDSLTFGGSNILFSGSKKRGEHLLCCSLENVLQGLELSMEQFIDFCILCGCDYTDTIPKVGPVTALKLIKEHHSIDHFKDVPETCNYVLARDLFKETIMKIDLPKGVKNKNTFTTILQEFGIEEKYFIDKLKFFQFQDF